MTRALVALVALVLAGCAGKAPAPAVSPATRAEPPAPSPAVPAPPAAAPATGAPPPAAAAPGTPAADPPRPASSPTAPAPATPAPDPAPAPRILYVKTHLANFRAGAGTSMRILRVLRQGARLEVLETRSAWLRVRLDDGQEGWVAESVTSATAPVTPAMTPFRAPGVRQLAGA
jgi:uncharacterized protein YgiM (DUF1202 family)